MHVESDFQSIDYSSQAIEINKSLYTLDKDQRGNLYDTEHLKGFDRAKIEEQAQNIACMVDASRLFQTPTGNYQLSEPIMILAKRIEAEMEADFGEIISFGKKESFYDEPAPGFGTAYFIGKDFALTSAHCILDIERIRLIFNFKMTENRQKHTFEESQIYKIKEAVCHQYQRIQEKDHSYVQWADWALLRLDRKVEGCKPLAINCAQKITKKMQLYMLGLLFFFFR